MNTQQRNCMLSESSAYSMHDPTHIDLARYFITERSNPTGADGRHFYTVEAEKRGERRMERPNSWHMAQSYWYQQAHKPILD
ncbi:hypothetical protein B7463_g4217, partial [Scytalidium lignicola]